jgi:Na+-driven multidrug efflux pump
LPFDVVREYLKITKLVWPLALGMMNNAVMQFVDRAFLSWYSLTALEAVLPAGMLMWVFAGFFQAIVGYSSVFVGMSHGAKDNDGTCSAYRAAGIIALGATLLSLPLIIFSMGLFTLVINILMMALAIWLTPGVHVDLVGAVAGTIILAIINSLLNLLVSSRQSK